MPSELRNSSVDFVHRLCLEGDESDVEDSSSSSSPCKSIKNPYSFRQWNAMSDTPSRTNSLEPYSFSSAIKHAGHALPQKKQQHLKLDSLLNLRQPSFSIDDPYSPLQSPTESMHSLTSCNSSASIMSELDSDLGTEVETDGELEDNVDTDILRHGTISDDANDDFTGTPVAVPPCQNYPLHQTAHRVNRSVLGIPFAQHQKPFKDTDCFPDQNESNEPTQKDSKICSPLGRLRSNPLRRSIWMPPAKVRRTQSMFATPEQMLHEQQLGNIDRTPACQPNIHGISFLNSSECPIPTFTLRHDPFPRIAPETLCRLMDREFQHIYTEIIVIDCRFEYEYEGGHIEGAININSKQQLEQVLFNKSFCESLGDKRLLVFHCEHSAYRSPLLASHLRNCDRNLNASNYPELCYPDVLVLDGGYSEFYNIASARCIPQNYVGMNHQAHQNTCQREMSKFRNGMKARKFQSLGMMSTPHLNDFKFPEPKLSLTSKSDVQLLRLKHSDDLPQSSTKTGLFGV